MTRRRRSRKTKNLTWSGLVVLIISAAAVFFARQFGPQGPGVTVLRVVDGDTIKVNYNGKEESVRLLMINTPEKNMPGYAEAAAALRQLVDGKEVVLEFETPGKEERDKYGRLLAYVFIGDSNINVEMVRLGWTKFWTSYGKGRYADLFAAAELEAKTRKRGLWSSSGRAVRFLMPALPG